jgi:hypothetical protein
VEVIPDWFEVFHKLEFLYVSADLQRVVWLWPLTVFLVGFSVVQGKYGEPNIIRMPPTAFSSMGSLTFLHFGYLPLLPHLPSFEGLHHLKSLSLALLYTITELPELKHLVNLQRLELVALSSVQAIPELSSNSQLLGITIFNLPVCCNGFIGDCNLANPTCSSVSGIRCLPPSNQGSDASRAIFAAQPAVCDKKAFYFPPPPPIAQDQVDMCGGVLYRECHDPRFQSPGNDVVGICKNSYFQVISCTSFEVFAISGRRQEIARGLGIPCDPIEEAWLGCG